MIPQMHSWYMGTLFIIIGAAISAIAVYFMWAPRFMPARATALCCCLPKKKRLTCGALPRFDRRYRLCRRVFDGRLSGPWHGAERDRHRAADAAGFPPVPFSFQSGKTRIAAGYPAVFEISALPRFRKITQDARWGVFLLR